MEGRGIFRGGIHRGRGGGGLDVGEGNRGGGVRRWVVGRMCVVITCIASLLHDLRILMKWVGGLWLWNAQYV